MLLLLFPGELLFRIALRTFLGLLFQLPPRMTRLASPSVGSGSLLSGYAQCRAKVAQMPADANQALLHALVINVAALVGGDFGMQPFQAAALIL